ncbi:MAG TPA: fibronectin type III domain-containing protein [Longimicrobiaceae bacterium]
MLNLPEPPTGIVATAVSPTRIDVTWEDTSDTEWSFRVNRQVLRDDGFRDWQYLGATSDGGLA